MDENIKSRIIATILQAFPHTIAIYLFGSFGTSAQTPESDIDLAFLLSPKEMAF